MKKFIKKRFPQLARILNQNYNNLVHYKYKNQSLKSVFKDIYVRNHWRDSDSASGTGSNLRQTETIRNELPILIKDLEIKSILDLPCGDFFWFDSMNLSLEKYTGGDIVEEIIQQNNKKYGNAYREFKVLDITEDKLPVSDLIFCRDCLVHFSYNDIFKTIDNIKNSNSKYLLTTTFPKHKNRNIVTGNWRQINLQIPPFNFDEPIRLINENCTEGDEENEDKSLALWEISKIK